MSQSQHIYDLIIIGGGINGCSIAADAAIKGLDVCLIEKNTIGSGTSSKSSNLIHGGLRYLENYDFKLVRDALAEQAIWQQRAPQLVKPLQFVLPHEKHLRPRWLLRLGLWFYDHLSSKKTLAHASRVSRQKNPKLFKALKATIQHGFTYYDCQTNGQQLTQATAQLAKDHGATIFEQLSLQLAEHNDNHWVVQCSDQTNNTIITLKAKALVNAAGPWACQINDGITPSDPHAHLQLIKGSHIIVPKLYDGDYAMILQHEDGRVVFTLPNHDGTTTIGTTDIVYHDDLDNVVITEDEKTYLCKLINHYFNKPITPEDIQHSYAGVRALASSKHQKASKLSREHRLSLAHKQSVPLLTVLGGKLTSGRLVAEETMAVLKPLFPEMKTVSTKSIPFPKN